MEPSSFSDEDDLPDLGLHSKPTSRLKPEASEMIDLSQDSSDLDSEPENFIPHQIKTCHPEQLKSSSHIQTGERRVHNISSSESDSSHIQTAERTVHSISSSESDMDDEESQTLGNFARSLSQKSGQIKSGLGVVTKQFKIDKYLDPDENELPDIDLNLDLRHRTALGGGLSSKLNSFSSVSSVHSVDTANLSTKSASNIDQTLPKKTTTEERKTQRQEEKLKKQQEREELKRKKQEEKFLLQQARIEKKKQQEYEKAKKRTLQEANRSTKPGECLKSMTVMVDPGALRPPFGGAILDSLQKAEIKYEVQPQPLDNMVSFWREVTEVKELEPRQLSTEKREVVENEVLLLITLPQFISAVQTLHKEKQGMSYMISDGDLSIVKLYKQCKQSLEGRNITLVVQGLEKYFSGRRSQEEKAYRSKMKGQGRGNKKKDTPTETSSDLAVTRLQVEEALLCLQLEEGGNVKFVEREEEMGKLVVQYTKAVAETPFKRGRLNTGLTTFVEGVRSVKVNKDGRGLLSLWRQQLQQFRNVSAETANAIIAEYPSPQDLWQAYKLCPSPKEAELLLQDIMVRRGVGVMANSRRIGKELSRKVYHLFTSEDPDFIIK